MMVTPEQIAALRARLGISFQTAADEMGVSKTALRQFEDKRDCWSSTVRKIDEWYDFHNTSL